MPSERGLRVEVGDDVGRPVGAARGLSSWLSQVAPAAARRSTVSVAIVSDRRVRDLNRRYRGLDAPTDVLSFSPGGNPQAVRDGAFLGDIVIAHGVARRQAARAGHSEREELRVLALHGLLHLLGYDHERDEGLMARVERRLRRKGGLPAGVIERAE